MLRSMKDLLDYGIAATDGPAGSVRDFYFDEEVWTVRYLVIDTGTILPGKKVLLAPQAIADAQWDRRLLAIPHTQDEIANGPSWDADKPVSRQEEEELHEYYQWAPYWAPGVPFGAAPVATPTPLKPPPRREETHLRSLREILGYSLEAIDGPIGHIEDFITDDIASI